MVGTVYSFHQLAQLRLEIDDTGTLLKLIGSKGLCLAEMTALGIPVPPGFVISSEVSTVDYGSEQFISQDIRRKILVALRELEQQTGKRYGDSTNPLLLSVRVSPPASMPGLMDTILNIGINDETVEGLARASNNARFAYDAYRRFVTMFSNVVMGISFATFESLLDESKRQSMVRTDDELNSDSLCELVKSMKKLTHERTGHHFPSQPMDQLFTCIKTAFTSWNNDRATAYRHFNYISGDTSIAVIIQAMVYGNCSEDSGVGVVFSRDPSTGEKYLFGEFLFNSQGEDVVMGIRDPYNVDILQENLSEIYTQLEKVCDTLEFHYRDVQDIDFTVERNNLYILQTRSAKRTARASIKIAVDFFDEEIISEKEFLFRVAPEQLAELFLPQIPDFQTANIIAKGLPASPGAASGKVIFDAKLVQCLSKTGQKVIYVTQEVNREDMGGLESSQGALTIRGGMTSHAAMAMKNMRKPCVTGARDIKLGETLKEGDSITIDGSTGLVLSGEIELIYTDIDSIPELKRFASLIYKVDPGTYIDYGLGTLWVLIDTIQNKSIPNWMRYPSLSANSIGHIDSTRTSRKIYKTFKQPDKEIIKRIIENMHICENLDMQSVSWGIMSHLNTLLRDAIGIGSHYLGIRPLIDPKNSFGVLSDKRGLRVKLLKIPFSWSAWHSRSIFMTTMP